MGVLGRRTRPVAHERGSACCRYCFLVRSPWRRARDKRCEGAVIPVLVEGSASALKLPMRALATLTWMMKLVGMRVPSYRWPVTAVACTAWIRPGSALSARAASRRLESSRV